MQARCARIAGVAHSGSCKTCLVVVFASGAAPSAAQSLFVPEHGHPIFISSHGPQHVPLREQASILFSTLAGVNAPSARLLFRKNHKHVERLRSRLYACRTRFVEKMEKQIRIGKNTVAWNDVEAGEVDLRKSKVGSGDSEKVQWEQWGGIVERGFPQTLILTRLQPIHTKPRAPRPGPIRKRDWAPIAKRHLKKRDVVLHTDDARAYKMHIPGVLHDNVTHMKKKWRWTASSNGLTRFLPRRCCTKRQTESSSLAWPGRRLLTASGSRRALISAVFPPPSVPKL